MTLRNLVIKLHITRQQERGIGAVLLGINTIVAVVLLTLMRMAGP